MINKVLLPYSTRADGAVASWCCDHKRLKSDFIAGEQKQARRRILGGGGQRHIVNYISRAIILFHCNLSNCSHLLFSYFLKRFSTSISSHS